MEMGLAVAEVLTNFAANPVGYRDGRRVWRLWAPLIVRLSDGKVIEIPIGFESDGASVPRDLILWHIFGDTGILASFVHDYLYRVDSAPVVSKAYADWAFWDVMYGTCDPPEKAKRDAMYDAVKLCGSGSFHRLKVSDSLLTCEEF